MQLPVDAELRDQARRFVFVFTCRRCVHFDPSSSGSCSLDFPVQPHLDVDLETAVEIAFCKAFEVW